MHEGRRPLVHFFSSERRPEAPKGRILVNGLGCGTGGLPGVPGCDILELRIWYKTAALRRGSPCRTWVPNGFCFFRRGACDER